MTLYEQKSFTVPASAGSAETCRESGHTMPDQHGKCLRCGEIPNDCADHGHVWLEADGSLYVRHRNRSPGTVAVHCRRCNATASLHAYGKSTAPPHTGPAREP